MWCNVTDRMVNVKDSSKVKDSMVQRYRRYSVVTDGMLGRIS